MNIYGWSNSMVECLLAAVTSTGRRNTLSLYQKDGV